MPGIELCAPCSDLEGVVPRSEADVEIDGVGYEENFKAMSNSGDHS